MSSRSPRRMGGPYAQRTDFSIPACLRVRRDTNQKLIGLDAEAMRIQALRLAEKSQRAAERGRRDLAASYRADYVAEARAAKCLDEQNSGSWCEACQRELNKWKLG